MCQRFDKANTAVNLPKYCQSYVKSSAKVLHIFAELLNWCVLSVFTEACKSGSGREDWLYKT